MKCVACGLPLSPSRNYMSCPRCGTAINSGRKSTASPISYDPPYRGGNSGAPLGVVAPPQNSQWGQNEPSPAYQPPMTQTPAPQPGQMWPPGSNIQQDFTPNVPQRPSPPQPPPTRRSHNPRAGYIIAGICVLAGAILLIFVYFMATGPGNNTTGNTGTPASTHAAPAVTPTSSASTPSPTATTYPGQQYINNAQMSSVQPSASQPAQPATTFKVNQQAYVAFDINTSGQSGAVCLIWYLNGKAVFNYAFAVGEHSTSSYAYATYGTPGTAYVELYWASSTSCSDQVLAQHVDFTITT
ncbi:MAG TPA: hypothetical protein VKR83_12425 [Ktedonobacteraceae bacterium]|nr:hypothetical protein [Ktedonobacteraceae bacterium]